MTNYTHTAATAAACAQPYQIPLFDPIDEAALYIHQPGFFAHLCASANGGKLHRLYSVSDLCWVLENLDPKVDNWISQAIFWSRLRRIVNVKSLSLAFLDLDLYKLPAEQNWSAGKSPEQAAESFMCICDGLGVPRPSVIVFSGRGLQPKWLFDKPVPRQALPRWRALEDHLIKIFQHYGADPVVRDPTRVMRIVRTTNSRSGELCRVVGMTPGDDGKPVLYGFDYFCEFVLPYARSQGGTVFVPQEKRIVGPNNGFTTETLNWGRLEDLRTLLRLRGRIEEGMRMTFLMYLMNFLALSHQVGAKTFYSEASVLADEIDPSWSPELGELRTVYEKMKSYKAGERIDWNGVKYAPLYTPKSETLIELFSISPEEMAHMKTIVDETTRRTLNAEAQMKVRRASGAVSRAEYEAHAAARQERALALRREGLSIRAIAEEMQLSKSQIQRYLQVSHVRHVN